MARRVVASPRSPVGIAGAVPSARQLAS